jgi:hypothetical protein
MEALKVDTIHVDVPLTQPVAIEVHTQEDFDYLYRLYKKHFDVAGKAFWEERVVRGRIRHFYLNEEERAFFTEPDVDPGLYANLVVPAHGIHTTHTTPVTINLIL